MKYYNFSRKFDHFPVFSVNEIKALDPSFHPRQLVDWQKRGYIRMLTKGFYSFPHTQFDERMLFHAAGRIYSPSYVSMESALSFHGILPEMINGITSISTKKTRTALSLLGTFSYRTVKPELFFGYEIINRESVPFMLANPEKAVLDFLYLNSSYTTAESIEELRFNTDALNKLINRHRFIEYLERFMCAALSKRSKIFMEVHGLD